MGWLNRLRNRLRADRVSRDIQRELAFHVAERTDELERQGLPRVLAYREARRRLGNYTLLTERTREVVMITWLDSFIADLRYAGRTMRNNPLFTLVVVLSLGLGIGANTAIFSLVNGLLLKALPVSDPASLVQVRTDTSHFGSFTNPMWEAFHERQNVLPVVAAVGNAHMTASHEGRTSAAVGNWVSGSFFPLLGVPAAHGRVIVPADDYRGCPAIAVLGHGYWQRVYGADPGVVGTTLTLDDRPVEIVGIAAPGFFGITVGSVMDLYLPLCASDAIRGRYSPLDARSTYWLRVLGRRPDDQSVATVEARLAALAPAVFDAVIPERWGPDRQAAFRRGTFLAAPAATGLSSVRERYQEVLIVLLAMVGVFLLIACTNVANLLLARATARQREIAMRVAIGAGRGRLVRQFLTESLLLSLAGACMGLLFAQWSSRLLVRMLSTRYNVITLDLSLDLRVLAFTGVVAVATGLIFGMAPAWRAVRIDTHTTLRAGGPGLSGRGVRATLGKALITGQVALSLVLLMGALLLVGTFWRLQTMDPGFQRDRVLLASLLSARQERRTEAGRATAVEFLDVLRALPGVVEASASEVTPIAGNSMNDNVYVGGSGTVGTETAIVWFNRVSEGYFGAMGTRLLDGREFRANDGDAGERVAVVNETMARRVFGTADALGRTFHTKVSDTEASLPIRIVGLVEDAKYRTLREEMPATAYVPLGSPDRPAAGLTYQIASNRSAGDLIPEVRAAVAEFDPTLGVEFVTLTSVVDDSLAQERILALLSGFFGGLALLLAVIGLYGIMAYTVARRTREIGIRIALGASRAGVHAMVLREVTRLAILGIALGVAGSVAATGVLRGFLYGVEPLDAISLLTAATLLFAVALLAASAPARRASRVDPNIVLREE